VWTLECSFAQRVQPSTPDALLLGGRCVAAGDIITFYIYLSNTGGVTLPVQLQVPALLVSRLSCTLGAQPVSQSTSLAPGATMVCNATYSVRQEDFMRGELFVNVSASAAAAGGRVGTQRYVWVTLQSRPQLVVEVDTFNCTLPAQAGAPCLILAAQTAGSTVVCLCGCWCANADHCATCVGRDSHVCMHMPCQACKRHCGTPCLLRATVVCHSCARACLLAPHIAPA
jgi:hypothetical protein